ncbi:MAG: PAS domain S-box protein, partial [Ginsengibacter sp.]
YNPHPGFDAAAIIGKDDYELHEPGTAERLTVLKESVLASGNPVHTEMPMIVNGKQEFYDLIIEPIKNERGKTEGITGVAVKITENVNAKKKLQESEESYMTIVNASNLGLWDYDVLNDKINLTGQMAEIYGYSSNEIITVQDLYDAIHPEDREIQAKHYKELLTPNTQYPCEVELRIISQTNQVKWIKSNCKSFFNEDGKMYRLVGTTTDITAQKSAESDLKRFKHMADNATEPFILMREDASFAYLNDVALERWGYSKEEALHIRVPDVDPNYTDEVFPPAFAAAQKGEVLLFETLHKRKDGTIYPVEVNMSGVILEGKPHLFAIARDIRERKKTEEILNYRKALLEAQNEAIPDAILIVDTKGNMLSFNQHFIKLWKIPEDIINRKDDTAALQFAMTQLTDPQAFIDRVNYCYAHPDEKAKEEVHFKDGRIIERYGNVVVGENGTSYGWAWYFRDITEQKKTEENIKIVKDQLELTFKNIPAGVYLLNHKGEMIYVNEKGAKVYGNFTPEDFLTEKDLPALYKKAEELFERYDDKGNVFKPQNSPAYITLSTGRSSEAILRQINKIDKEERWLYLQGAPLFDEEGKVSMVLVTSTDITVQKNAEEKIRQSEERFQAAVAAVEGILWTNNANGEMEGEQPGWAMLTGQTFEEYQGYGWSSAVHPDDAHPTMDAWNETVKEKKIFIFEHRVKMKDGNWGHFSIRAIPLLNNDGSIRQWVGVHTNITEKRQAEELLRESEEQLRSLANSIPQLAWMTDAEGWIYWYNQRWYDYTGTTLEEVQGWGWQSVHHPDLIEDVTEHFSKAIAAGVPYEQTFLLRSKEGEYRWFLTRAIPIINDEGKVVQWFGTNTDVTDQRNTEDALKESEARFRLLADSMPQQIWTGDAECNLNYFNAAVYEFSGLTFEDIQREGWIQIVHPDDREANITKWMHSIKTGEDFFIEHRFKHNSGEYRWQLSRAIPQKNNE